MKEPWELYPSIWKSQAAFFAYLRGGIRMIWSRYPAKLQWKKEQLSSTPPAGYAGRGKSFGKCHYCSESFTGSSLEVDHKKQAGTCNSWDTAQEFLHNLLDCNSNWVLACKPCHKIKSYAERTGKSFEEAVVEKRVIEATKWPVGKINSFLAAHQYVAANAKQRREALTKIFNKENNDKACTN